MTTYYQNFIQACKQGDVKTVQDLIRYVKVEDNSNKALREACYEGHAEIVKLLLQDPRVNPFSGFPGDKSCYALRVACIGKNPGAVIPILLEDPRVDPSLENNIALKECFNSRYSYYPALQLLLRDERVIRKLDTYTGPLNSVSMKEAAEYWLPQKPTLAKYFIGKVAPEIITKYGGDNCMTEFDMF